MLRVRQRISANTYFPRCTRSLRFPAEMSAAADWWTRVLRKGWLAGPLGMYKGHRRHAQANRHDLRLFTAKPAESRCPQSRKEKFHPELQLGLCYCLLSEGSLFPCCQLRDVPNDHTFFSWMSGWSIRSLCYWDVDFEIGFYLFVGNVFPGFKAPNELWLDLSYRLAEWKGW